MIRVFVSIGCALSVLTLAACAQNAGEKPAAAPATTKGAEQAHGEMGMPDLHQGEAVFDSAGAANIEVLRAKTGHLLVRPIVNGKQVGWFIFDTAAGICVISTPHAEAFGLDDAGEIQAEGVGGSKAAGLKRAKTFALGPVTLRNHPIMITDLSFLKQHLGEEIIGVVGFGVFSKCVAEIDVSTPRIAIHDPATYKLAKGEWTALDLSKRVPAVKARFEDHDGSYRIDTGKNGYVTFHQPAVEKWDLLKNRELTDAKLGGVGGFVAAKQGKIAWFELGGVRTENVSATFATEAKGNFAETDMAGTIGGDMLRPFVVVFDYTHERVAFVVK